MKYLVWQERSRKPFCSMYENNMLFSPSWSFFFFFWSLLWPKMLDFYVTCRVSMIMFAAHESNLHFKLQAPMNIVQFAHFCVYFCNCKIAKSWRNWFFHWFADFIPSFPSKKMCYSYLLLCSVHRGSSVAILEGESTTQFDDFPVHRC